MTQQETGYERRRGFTEVDPGESISYLIVGRTRHGGVEHKKVVYTLNEVKKGRRQLWADSPYLIITVYSFLDKAAPPSIEEDTPSSGTRLVFSNATWAGDIPTPEEVGTVDSTPTDPLFTYETLSNAEMSWEDIRSATRHVQQLNFRGFGDEDTRSGIFNNIQAETMETQEAERLRLRRLEIMNAHAALAGGGGEEVASLIRQVMDTFIEVPDETPETPEERELRRRAYECAAILTRERELEAVSEGLDELLRRQDTDIPF